MANKGFVMLNQKFVAPFRNDADFPVWARALFYIIQSADWKTGFSYVTAGDMVEKLGAHRNSVDAAVAFLVKKHFVTRIDGRGRSKHFRLNPSMFPLGEAARPNNGSK